MRDFAKAIQTLGLAVLVTLTASGTYGQKHPKPTPAVSVASENSSPVRLKLIDGSSLDADEAWESQQGIWYRRGGMSHLIAKDRVKRIERGSSVKQTDSPAAKIAVTEENEDDEKSTSPAADQPVWIYLVGGARFEADYVSESAAGAWYRRGSLSVFVERARIDHIEREVLAESDSSKKFRGWTTGHSRIDGLIKQNGAKYGVDPYLIFCVMEQESHFNTRALSPKGGDLLEAKACRGMLPCAEAQARIQHDHALSRLGFATDPTRLDQQP